MFSFLRAQNFVVVRSKMHVLSFHVSMSTQFDREPINQWHRYLASEDSNQIEYAVVFHETKTNLKNVSVNTNRKPITQSHEYMATQNRNHMRCFIVLVKSYASLKIFFTQLDFEPVARSHKFQASEDNNQEG